ncbi:MAG: hypothetical protein PHD13_07410 [Methanocellales archaeon]|nr:hypothetical protein [Methanocellales archaeon]MDD3292405.1 hypothetical protein [Methanocellales archaeon]MDD5235983.1 hypothetical protein [Methanocellales archaeon]MDD5485290.1 hypothetical protein [Methanocellales archaeon]
MKGAKNDRRARILKTYKAFSGKKHIFLELNEREVRVTFESTVYSGFVPK